MKSSAFWGFTSLLVLFLAVETILPGMDLGKSLKFGKAEVFFTSTVKEDEARKLGDFLEKYGFFPDREVSIQLTREGPVYFLRFPVKKDLEKDLSFIRTIQYLITRISRKVFADAEVRACLCDPELKTLLTVSGAGKLMEFGKGELFYSPGVTDQEAKRLGEYLVKEEFFDEREKTVQIFKLRGGYAFRMVFTSDGPPKLEHLKNFRNLALNLTSDVFGGKLVDIHLCDASFETRKVVLGLGEMLAVKNSKLFFGRTVGRKLAEKLRDFLDSSKFFDGPPQALSLERRKKALILRIKCREGAEKDPNFLSTVKILRNEIAARVFGGAPVELQICDQYFLPRKTLPPEPQKK